MNTTYRDWKGLPPELLQVILSLAAKEQSQIKACNVALVCKGWSPSAQAAAYSTTAINSLSRFKKFHDVIVNSPHLGNKVKTLDLKFVTCTLQETDTIELSSRLTSLLTTSLPNLEVLKMTKLYTRVPSLHTLLDSHLIHMKKLQRPDGDSELENYTKCAFMMKERLKNMYIHSYSCIREQFDEKLNIHSQRLYDSLNQFSNLVEITTTKNTYDRIQVVEHIVEACRFLKDVKIYFTDFDIDQPIPARPNINVFIGTLTKYIPRSNIKSLTITASGLSDYRLLLYIMHKFPKLQKLSLRLEEASSRFDTHLIVKFLDYVSLIDEISVHGLSVIQGNLMETIGNYWQNLATHGSRNLHIEYSDYCHENIKAFDITKIVGGGDTEITLKYPTNVDFNWRLYMHFIEKCGKYIGTLWFDIMIEDDDLGRSELRENFFPETLAHCPNLKKLQINGCLIKHFIYPEVDNKFAIDELSFQFCQIQHGVFDQLSRLLLKVRKLGLYCNMIYFPEDEDSFEEENEIDSEDESNIGNEDEDGFDDDIAHTTDEFRLQITMPHTTVDCIIFEVDGPQEIIYVKIFLLSDEKHYYYRICTAQNEWIESSTKQECEAKNNNRHVYVSCRTKPTLQLKKFY